MVRKFLVGAALIGASALAVGNALSVRAPEALSGWWPGHPSVLYGSALRDFGSSGMRGQAPDRTLVEAVVEAGRRDPLSPQPLLVRGIAAREAGQAAIADQAFRAAVARSPRDGSSRYFVAQQALDEGRIDDALAQFGAMARILPNARIAIGQAMADYARAPGGARRVAAVLRRDPDIRILTLDALSNDPRNYSLIMSIAGDQPSGEQTMWQGRLVNGLVQAGNYRDALTAWQHFARARGVASSGELLRDPSYADQRTAPPFGWQLYSGSAGLAERGENDLRAIHYGREPVVLAQQLLVLSPGRYRLSIADGSGTMGSLEWRVRCERGLVVLLRVPLAGDALGNGAKRDFTVPAGDCGAQRIELMGVIADSPSDARIPPLRLTAAS